MRTRPTTLPGTRSRRPFLVLPSAPLASRVALATPTAYAAPLLLAVLARLALPGAPTLAGLLLSLVLGVVAFPVRDRLARRFGHRLPGVVTARDDSSREVVAVLEGVRRTRAPGWREVLDRFGSAYLDGSFAPPKRSRNRGFERRLRYTSSGSTAVPPVPLLTWVLLHDVEVVSMVAELGAGDRRALAAAVVDVARLAPVTGEWPHGPDDALVGVEGRERGLREVEYLLALSALLRSGVPHAWAVRHLARESER